MEDMVPVGGAGGEGGGGWRCRWRWVVEGFKVRKRMKWGGGRMIFLFGNDEM